MSTTARRQDLALELADAVEAFGPAFNRWIKSQTGEPGLTYPRLRLLNALHWKGPQIMSDLALLLGVTARNITDLVDGLEADGLVRRQPHPTDRRATVIELTDRADASGLFEAHRAAVAGLFGGLSEADQRELLRLVRLLGEQLRARGADPA